MKRILFFFLLTALPFLAAAQGTVKDSVTVLTDAQINFGTWVDSVRMYFIQGGTWKKQRMDTLAQYVATKIGGVTTFSAGTTGLTPSTATSGAVTLAGTLSIANGGTNATTASQARTNLGLAIGTDVLAPNGSAANLTNFPTLNQNTTGTAANVTGTVAIGNGGTGATTQQGAINALAGATTSGQYLRGNGTNITMSAIQAGDVPTLNQNTTGSAASLTTPRDIQVNLASTSAASFSGTANIQPGVTGTLPVGNGGTGQTSYTDGQLLIGNTATGGLSKATLTAGSNVTITNGNGTITIAATGGGGGGSGVISGVVAGEVGYGIGADSLGGESALYYDATNNRLSVGGETSPTATLQVKGSGTATGVSLLVENSAGADRFSITDDGEIDLYNTAVTNNQTNGTAYINNMTTNGSIVIATNGTGAFILDLPNGTAAGGNTRGNNAVDLQTVRSTAARVASGTNSVITGGNSNTASSTATFIGSGELNTASGGYSSVVAGYGNTASGSTSFIGGGESNSATTEYSAILGGFTNSASTTANYSAIGGGRNNTAQANYVSIPGGFRSFGYLYGQNALGSGQFAAQGDAQSSTIRLRRSITGTGADTLTLDGTAYSAAATGRAILNISSPTGTNGRLWNAKIQVVAIVQTQGNGTADSVAVGRSFIGNYAVGIKRITNNTSLVGTVQNLHTPQADAGMGGCVVTIDADDTNEALRVQFTPPSGAGSTTVIRVVATVYLTEVGY